MDITRTEEKGKTETDLKDWRMGPRKTEMDEMKQ